MKWGRDNEALARDTYKSHRLNQFKDYKAVVEFEPPPSYLPREFQHVDIVPVDPNEISSKPYTIDIQVRGLIVHPTLNWMGYSSDGEVFETDDKGLLEIKCPQRMYAEVPHSYYDQMQFGMFNLGLKWCDFFVWMEQGYTLKRYAFNEDYWNQMYVVLPAKRRLSDTFLSGCFSI